jgi:hypothetical protein
MPANELAPDRMPQTAMKTTLIRGCLRVRSTRGSMRPWKWSWNEAESLAGIVAIHQVRFVGLRTVTPLYANALRPVHAALLS